MLLLQVAFIVCFLHQWLELVMEADSFCLATDGDNSFQDAVSLLFGLHAQHNHDLIVMPRAYDIAFSEGVLNQFKDLCFITVCFVFQEGDAGGLFAAFGALAFQQAEVVEHIGSRNKGTIGRPVCNWR